MLKTKGKMLLGSIVGVAVMLSAGIVMAEVFEWGQKSQTPVTQQLGQSTTDTKVPTTATTRKIVVPDVYYMDTGEEKIVQPGEINDRPGVRIELDDPENEGAWFDVWFERQYWHLGKEKPDHYYCREGMEGQFTQETFVYNGRTVADIYKEMEGARVKWKEADREAHKGNMERKEANKLYRAWDALIDEFDDARAAMWEANEAIFDEVYYEKYGVDRDPTAWLEEQGIYVDKAPEDGREYRILATKEQLENLKLPEKCGVILRIANGPNHFMLG